MTSGRMRIISQASSRHGSASGKKKIGGHAHPEHFTTPNFVLAPPVFLERVGIFVR